MSSQSADRIRTGILEWGSENLRDFPWRERDKSIYEVFIAEFFLTQTPPGNVVEVYPKFLKKYPSLKRIESSPKPELRSNIRPLGFQSMRADALKEMAGMHDELPRTAAQLRKLPRVGRYVANATISFADGRPLPIVDRNVNRIYERLFPEDYPPSEGERWEFASEMLPETGEDTRVYNISLIDFGSLVCKKSSPKCDDCLLADLCEYRR